MATLSLQDVSATQSFLHSSTVLSAVSGDIGLNFHGVDVVTHDVELCIPAAMRDIAISALEAHPDAYARLPDCLEPDFYHPHKRGAARFQLLNISMSMELHLVVDNMLGLDLTDDVIQSGMTAEDAHQEIKEYCNAAGDDELSSIRWLSLPAFTSGWLRLAIESKASDNEIVYLMYAERLIDANDVDYAWFKRHLDDPACVEIATEILQGKKIRLTQSQWY